MTTLKGINKVACLSLCGGALSLIAMAMAPVFGGEKIPSSLYQNIQKSNKSFKKCHLEALRFMQEGKLSPERFRARLTGCQERYPGASLYINCKKNALTTFKKDQNEAKAKIAACKQLLLATSFDPLKPLPFYLSPEGEHYFAGIGFNRPLSLKELDLPNFNCEKLKALARNPQQAEYFLFGHDPKLFPAFASFKPKQLWSRFRLPLKLPTDGYYIARLGKLFSRRDGARAQELSLYFPSGSCIYQGELGPNLTGLSSYYLIDPAGEQLLPYFTIAFYHPEAAPSRKTLTEELLSMLKQGANPSPYRLFTHGEGMSLLARASIEEFDEEGDPYNLCRKEAEHEKLAVIKSRDKQTDKVEYILVANVEQLCQFGKRISAQFKP